MKSKDDYETKRKGSKRMNDTGYSTFHQSKRNYVMSRILQIQHLVPIRTFALQNNFHFLDLNYEAEPAFSKPVLAALPYLVSGIKISSTVHVFPPSAETGFEATIPFSIISDFGNPMTAAAKVKVLFLYARICSKPLGGFRERVGVKTYCVLGLFLRNRIALLRLC